MKKEDKYIKIAYIFSIVCFIIGINILLTWSYTSRLIGALLVLFSILIAYYCYKKSNPNYEFFVNKRDAVLGFLLLFIDITYNFISVDTFRSFDYGIIISGFIIILLNLGLFSFLKLDRKIIKFITYFIFITMLLYGFLFSGLPFLFGDKDNNLLFKYTTKSVIIVAGYFLNFLKTTVVNGNTINFQGFSVYVGDPCSGVESISVFFSAAIAYLIAMRVKDIKKMLKYMLIGIFILYIVNICRIIIIILTGYYLGVEKMMFVHSNLGWVFFLVAMAFFWNYLSNNISLKDKSI